MTKQPGLYIIELSTGDKIPVRFCTWSLNQFCEINGGLTLKELQGLLSENISLDKFMSLVLCAAEYMCVKEQREFNYTKMDVSEWIDDLGGMAGKGMQEMLLAITESLTPKSKTAKNG